MKKTIIIPARYASTRLPGKPLVQLAGKTMLSRVVAIAWEAIKGRDDCTVVVATDDERIIEHCAQIGVEAVMTPTSCLTGSDRVLVAAKSLQEQPEYLINLQGDAPLTPPHYITAILNAWDKDPSLPMITPITQLSWEELESLRERKKQTPFSGTVALADKHGKALWFSKQILPAIREEETMRRTEKKSPVWRHIGLYGYRREFLETYVSWPQTPYEKSEGLEQLRVLENGHSIHCVLVESGKNGMCADVDSPEDVLHVEHLLTSGIL